MDSPDFQNSSVSNDTGRSATGNRTVGDSTVGNSTVGNSTVGPWLSVIVPTYNGQSYIAQSLQSIVNQNQKDLEVIIVDDGSSDQTLEIVHSFSNQLALKVFSKSRGKSWVKSTNFGIEHAKGKYLSFLHQDDYWLPDRLSILRRLTEQSPESVLFLHPSFFVNQQGQKIGRWTCPFPKDPRPLEPSFVFSRLIVQNFISIPAPLFLRSAVLESGPMREELWFTADWELWLRLSLAGNWVYYPKELSCFRIHAESQTVVGSPGSKNYRDQYLPIIESFKSKLDSRQTEKIARFSNQINCALAEKFHGQKLPLTALIASAVTLGPIGFYRYLNYSRIVQRVLPRLKEQLRNKKLSKKKSHNSLSISSAAGDR